MAEFVTGMIDQVEMDECQPRPVFSDVGFGAAHCLTRIPPAGMIDAVGGAGFHQSREAFPFVKNSWNKLPV
jgi:hypothetical protein